MHRKLTCCLFAALVLCTAAPASANPPEWLRKLVALPADAQTAKAAAVVLLDEQSSVIEPDGNVKTTTRFAVRIQSRDGRDAAHISESYLTDSGKVRDIRAWLIPPTGLPKEYGKDGVVDVALVDNDIYNEVRFKFLSAGNDAEPGTVFGGESTSETRMPFGHFEWTLQEEWPVKTARRVLSLPEAWAVSSVTFNRPPIQPSVNGNTYTWELSDLPGIERESLSPTKAGIAARVAVTVRTPGGPWASMDDWSQVSRWLFGLSEKQAAPDAAITAKTKELVAGAKSEVDRIRAIGKYVQLVRYISIQTGLGRGGGYQPRPASEVFARNYGDCKNKATLMRAMLAAVGIKSYSVSIFSGDRTYVREEWPSPQQFNHAIVAVALAEKYDAPAVVTQQPFGTLMFFDPTDEDSTVGHLPQHEQGSLALLVAQDAGALVRIPRTGAEGNRLERQVDGTVAADGTYSATVRNKYLGESSSNMRGSRREMTPAEYRQWVERVLTKELRTVKLGKVDCQDDQASALFREDFEFSSPGYAQLLQGKLLVFRPPTFGSPAVPDITAASRHYPVTLDAWEVSETVRIAVPAGFKVDELPEATDITTEFGRVKTAWKVDGSAVVGERQFRMENATVPVEKYGAVKQFVDKMRASRETALVLVKSQ